MTSRKDKQKVVDLFLGIDPGDSRIIAEAQLDVRRRGSLDEQYEVAKAWIDGWVSAARRMVQVVHEHLDGVTPLVGVREVCRITGLAERTVRTYVTRGTLPDPVPVDGSDALLWDRAVIEEWDAERRRRGRKGSRQ